eukprot:TRINITY_DN105994_c0_g1_i1.p1 TRINITY_DN105994_c0_g1~~TRINITY_DN105994_c0_g1_i1.p1  ORF type:complete len:284 (+),score=9.36 TRINITY_DN105994_c0_g1_i1:321-1172(+)
MQPAARTVRQALPRLQKNINCTAMMRLLVTPSGCLGRTLHWGEIPKWLADHYTHNSTYTLTKRWYNESYIAGEGAAKKWSNYSIYRWAKKAAEGACQRCPYEPCGHVLLKEIEQLRGAIKGKNALVIGSATPWIESLLLGVGAAHVWTLEYGKIETTHAKLTPLLPEEVLQLYEEGTRFDFGVTYSSLEHSGLTRYGDPARPYGDLEAMAQAWCLLKPGARFILGVPRSRDHGKKRMGTRTQVVWSAAREYGIDRLIHMAANWEHTPPWTLCEGDSIFQLTRL